MEQGQINNLSSFVAGRVCVAIVAAVVMHDAVAAEAAAGFAAVERVGWLRSAG